MRKAVTHLANATIHKMEKGSNLYEIFGCDFMLDNDLKVWFIECGADTGF